MFSVGGRKIKAAIAFILMYFFRCFPVKKNKIFMFSYYGNQYGCNPKYISEYILRKHSSDTFDIVWAFNDLSNKAHLTGIRKVKTMSLRYFYELCTSKVIITNFRTTELFLKRKGQYYIQTWHSSLRLKKIEQDAEESLPADYVKMAKSDSQKCDLLLSGCKFSTETFKKSFWYSGEIFEHGTPRNDIFFQSNSDMKKRIMKQLDLPLAAKLVLYAPTFRKDESLEVYNLNYQMVLEKLRDKFGGNWIFLVKLHPHLGSKSAQLAYGENVVDVTSYDDTQELLNVSDILISDYSSLMFDYCITERPCFLFVPDLEVYIKNDRDLYFDLKKLPFISATNNLELTENIDTFNRRAYRKSLSEFINTIGSFENGNACEYLVDTLNEVCLNQKRRRKRDAAEAI